MTTAGLQAIVSAAGHSLRPEQYVRRACPFTVGRRWVVTDNATGARLIVARTPAAAFRLWQAARLTAALQTLPR